MAKFGFTIVRENVRMKEMRDTGGFAGFTPRATRHAPQAASHAPCKASHAPRSSKNAVAAKKGLVEN